MPITGEDIAAIRVYPALVDALETRGALLRVLTSEYIHVTDPQGLRWPMLLAERGADVRLFQAYRQRLATGPCTMGNAVSFAGIGRHRRGTAPCSTAPGWRFER